MGANVFSGRHFTSSVMEHLTKILFVASGGAIGAVARYLVNISPLSRLFENFPFPTFFINVSGSFLIGLLLIVLTDRIAVNDNLRMMVIVGFLGAYTTFSTFEAETYGLLTDRLYAVSAAYVLLSVGAGFAAFLAGVWLGRNM